MNELRKTLRYSFWARRANGREETKTIQIQTQMILATELLQITDFVRSQKGKKKGWEFQNALKNITPLADILNTFRHALLVYLMAYLCGSGSSIGIATDYGLDGQGIESLWGGDFPQPSRTDNWTTN